MFITTSATTYPELARRKNKPDGATQRRSCECSVNPLICPHTAAARLLSAAKHHEAGRLTRLSIAGFTTKLRAVLADLNIPDAEAFGTHAFRRGLSADLLAAKTPLHDILAACDWRSGVFSWYMGRSNIDTHAVLAAAHELSDGDD